ncbi:hypothetical protein TNCT_150701 [Trichonephila clavata]|uniref:Uncharacterized protein n=1 Tax=Trichonephila clavata TaxID=2740835 RepID=A0A8X6HVL1_TRICU|nr:hypothetical protein TNCT_150701 [Trichonephila clavata]
MSNKPDENEVSKAHLDAKEQEIELEAVKKHCEEQQDFNKELKANTDRKGEVIGKAKENIRQYKKRLELETDDIELCSGIT